MKFSNHINLQTKLALTLSPLFYTTIGDRSHDSTRTWLDYNELICLNSNPRNNFIVILDEYLTFEKMGIKSFTF